MWDLLLTDCHAATMVGEGFGVTADAAIAIEGDRIAWVGAATDASSAHTTASLGGAWVTPGLVDCHTHLVFGGTRVRDWQMRAGGASYEDVARAGGGIVSTVAATRAASEDELVASGAARARVLARQGVTTVEIKSGYGLDTETELKMLRAAKRIGPAANVHVARTFLGAHTLPPEFRNDRAGYVDLVCETMLPAVAREHLAEAVDVFCESIAFNPAETDRILTSARAHGLSVKMHAEQLSDCGGAALAARHGALSADHLEHLGEDGIAAMRAAGSVAVLLPSAFYFLRETRKPPVAALRAAGVPIAIATDCNPGTSPQLSPLLTMNMACTLFGLTPAEALAGMTRNGARALGLDAEIGTLAPGKRADLAIWDIHEPAELCYWLGADLLKARYLAGRRIQDDRP
jgi:imidazolonepropionase